MIQRCLRLRRVKTGNGFVKLATGSSTYHRMRYAGIRNAEGNPQRYQGPIPARLTQLAGRIFSCAVAATTGAARQHHRCDGALCYRGSRVDKDIDMKCGRHGRGAHKRHPPTLPAVGATLVVARFAHRVPQTGLVKRVMPGPSPASHRPPGTGATTRVAPIGANLPPCAVESIMILGSDESRITFERRLAAHR